MESEETTIPVEIQDLERLNELLVTAFNACKIEDLRDAYRKMTNRHQWSPMTRAIQEQIRVVRAYLDEAKQEEDEDNAES